jgi:hypothetical protein
MERPKLDGETAERIINLLRNNPGLSMILSDISDGTELPVEDLAVYKEELDEHQHMVAETTDDGFDLYRFPENQQRGSAAPPNS